MASLVVRIADSSDLKVSASHKRQLAHSKLNRYQTLKRPSVRTVAIAKRWASLAIANSPLTLTTIHLTLRRCLPRVTFASSVATSTACRSIYDQSSHSLEAHFAHLRMILTCRRYDRDYAWPPQRPLPPAQALLSTHFVDLLSLFQAGGERERSLARSPPHLPTKLRDSHRLCLERGR